MFHVPKHYFHDRTILALAGANLALAILAIMSVILGLQSEENPTNIVAYRATTKIGQISGPTSDLYQFAIFATIVLVASLALSVKLYLHRRHLAVGILGLSSLLLIMTIIIFNALTRTL
jgi:hypothetical protein